MTRSRRPIPWLGGLALLAVARLASAAEWDTAGGLAVAAVYTDNVCLARDDKQGKAFATATPDVRLSGRGARASVNLNARVLYNSLADEELDCPQGAGLGGLGRFRERFIPSGSFLATFEAVENWLTFDANASATQNAVNPLAPGGDDPLTGRGNTNISYRYGAGATAQRRIEQAVDFFLRYQYSEQVNTADFVGLPDATQDSVQGSLGMVPGAQRLTLSVNGRYTRVSFDEDRFAGAQDNELSAAEAQAVLQLSDSWQLNGLYGREWNDFISAFDDIDGTYWDAGVRWAPNSRVEVNAGTGERFFGETPRFAVSYRHKRTLLRASYLRTIQFPFNLRSPRPDPDDPFGPDFGELPGDPVTSPSTPTLPGQGPIKNESLSLDYSFTARRTIVALSASESEQLRLLDGSEFLFRNARATLTRRLSPRLNASVRLGWRETEGRGAAGFGGFGRNVETWTGGLNLTRRFGNDLTVTLAYRYRQQESPFVFNEFEENRITLSARIGLF
jgi:hypothetical protein